MTGLIVATSIIGAVLISAIVVGAIKIYRMEKDMITVAQCLMVHMTNPDKIDVVEDISKPTHTGFDFPNTSGF